MDNCCEKVQAIEVDRSRLSALIQGTYRAADEADLLAIRFGSLVDSLRGDDSVTGEGGATPSKVGLDGLNDALILLGGGHESIRKHLEELESLVRL